MVRVYADMVADLFHYGHADFLRRARELGDELVVGVHSDTTAASYKRRPVMTMEERVRVVQACRWVDNVLPDAPLATTRSWITRHGIDLVVHGDDLDRDQLNLMYRAPLELGILRTIPHTPGISTTEVLRRLEERVADP
jgi:ethanolamine-phosphate cytidylyltransferase/choline-phosphate cytidylyltransferase